MLTLKPSTVDPQQLAAVLRATLAEGVSIEIANGSVIINSDDKAEVEAAEQLLRLVDSSNSRSNGEASANSATEPQSNADDRDPFRAD